MYDNLPAVFYETLRAWKSGYTHIVNQGGTSSAKTYNTNLALLTIASNERCGITITGRSVPFLKRGALLDMQEALMTYPKFERYIKDFNVQDRKYKFFNGSFIEFPTFPTEGDAKGGKRDYLFINEADSMTYAIADHLIIRTKKARFYDYNPTAPFWVHDKILPKKTTKLIISDHRQNLFISDEKHAEIESVTDPQWHRVYARGLTGQITNICFPNWKFIRGNDWRQEVKEVIYGIDFGWTSSKTAIVKINVLSSTEVVLEQVYYYSDCDDNLIYDIILNDGGRDCLLYCDHNSKFESGKTEQFISLLRRKGLRANPAFKQQKAQQILKIRGVQVWLTETSKEINEERMRYKFKMMTDSTGTEIQTNIIDESTANDLMDASQYGIYTHFLRTNKFI